MRRALLAGVLLTVCVPAVRAGELPTAIDDCIRRLDAATDVGYQHIAARCPELTPALAASRWASRFPPDWRQNDNELSVAGLQELRTLLARQEQPRPAVTPTPDTARVAPLLAKLQTEQETRGGWWLRFKHWLRNLLAPHAAPDEAGWLRRLFGGDGVPELVQKAVLWGSLLLLVALATAIILNELRVAGLMRRLSWRSGRRPAGPAADPQASSLQELEAVEPLLRARLLLNLIAARLVAQERLPPARSLTVRELVRAAQLPDATDRARLETLGAIAERARYSDRDIAPETLGRALTQGRELLAALTAPPSLAQSA
jgi:hypothetical protein